MLNKITTNGLVMFTAGMMFFSGCGGGGSGSSSSTSLPSVNAVQAAPTAENGVKVVNVLKNGAFIGDLSLLSVSEEKSVSFDPVKFTLQQNDILKKIATETYALNEAINEDLSDYICTDGGSAIVTGDQTATHADITVTFNNCSAYGTTMNGKMRMVANGTDYGETVTNETISFPTDFTVAYSGDSMKILSGSSIATTYTSYDYYSGDMAGTTTSSVQWEYGSFTERYDNLEVAFSYAYDTDTYIENYKGGRIYIDNLTAYLDIDSCPVPFKTVYAALQEGHVILSGTGGTVDIEVTDVNTITVTGTDGSTTISVY